MDIASINAAAREAASRLDGRIVRTPVTEFSALSAQTGALVQLKLDHLQHTGSFKYRGALNRLLTLDPAVRERGVVVASSGNHGAAVARAAAELDTPARVFVPKSVASRKRDAIEAYSVDVELFGDNGLETELYARDFASRNSLFYVSPYNDPEVVAGQGSLGVELLDDLPELDAVVIAVGGGGLLAGVGSVIRSANAGCRIIAVQPEASSVMAQSVAAGSIIECAESPTLSDGTAGGIEAGAITFDPVRLLADEFVLIPEFEIAVSMRELLEEEGLLVEGAAALTTAAIRKLAPSLAGKTVAAVICGGNVSTETADLALAMAGVPAEGPSSEL